MKISSQGVTVLLASHALDEVEKICTHVCILKNGGEVIQGKITDLVKGEEIIEISAKNLEELTQAVSKFNGAEKINQEGDKLIIKMTNDKQASELNQYLIQNNIAVSHFTSRIKSLEKFYLEKTE